LLACQTRHAMHLTTPQHQLSRESQLAQQNTHTVRMCNSFIARREQWRSTTQQQSTVQTTMQKTERRQVHQESTLQHLRRMVMLSSAQHA
jgi:hypothetical protein